MKYILFPIFRLQTFNLQKFNLKVGKIISLCTNLVQDKYRIISHFTAFRHQLGQRAKKFKACQGYKKN